MTYRGTGAVAAVLSIALSAHAQMDMSGSKAEQRSSPEHAQTGMSMGEPQTLGEAVVAHVSSGTSVEPAAARTSMLMTQRGGWMLMLHGEAFVSEIQQHANFGRGGDKLFSTNWVMPMAQHAAGERGTVTVRGMISLEPATVTGRYYPELFQQGETAYGRPIVDGQHPHDFLMELAAIYDLRLGKRGLLSLYAAPVGDPAIGPTAYPHRASAAEDPIAPLGHHQEDSTHIAFNVVTGGLTFGPMRVEASGFHGAEPTESRWSFAPSSNGHAMDSAAVRFTWSPLAQVSAQYSAATIASPEALAPGVNQRRQTASLMWVRPVGAHHDATSMPGMDMSTPGWGEWTTTLLWGRTQSSTGLVENSFLAESLLRGRRNAAWTRVETAARTTELETPAPPVEQGAGHVQAYSAGFDREWRAGAVRVAPGLQFTAYQAPDALAATYGRTPVGGVVFVRVRLGR